MTLTSSATTRPDANVLDARTELIVEQARDEERRRIARELHDDISQQLALLTIDLHRVRQQAPASHPDLGERLDAIMTRAQEIGTSLRNVSHQLHMSRLGDFGLAVRSWCQQIATHYDIDVRVTCDRVPSLSSELSHALFHILQEALQNIVKHSGASSVSVEIVGRSADVSLRIVDNGQGFDVETLDNSGIGLANIRERLAPFGGNLSISSAPSQGACLEISVPAWRAQRAAA